LYEVLKAKKDRGVKLFAIAAACRARCIGVNGELPWRLPSDLKRFRKLTTGHHLIVGRATYESIGRPLPNRKMIIVTSDPDYRAEGSVVVHSLQEAIEACPTNEVSWVIGGSKVYHQMIKYCDTVHLTEVNKHTNNGDAFFPSIDFNSTWYLLYDEGWQQPHEKDEYKTRYTVWGQLGLILQQCGLDIFAGTEL
jgi:dihydrofolate reductase